MRRRDILFQLKAARRKNIEVYKRLADALPDEEKQGWRPRDPKDPDITMLIVENSLRRFEKEALEALREINKNDEEITRLSRKLVDS